MSLPSVIIHERLASWSRQLRPRFQGWPIRWSETRSAKTLIQAASRSPCPILMIGLDRRPVRALEDFHEAMQVAPAALSMVFDPFDREEVAMIARDLGATIVLSGLVIPPEVEHLLQRWLPIARQRSEAQGWSASNEPEPEAWEQPDLIQPSHPPDPAADQPK